MKMNKAVLTAAALATMAFSQVSLAKDGTIKFTGDIVDTPCVVAQESQEQTVKLGQVKQSVLNGAAGQVSAGKQFQIVLEECVLDATTPEKAYITFSGLSSQANVLDVGLESGSASGVGIQLSDASGAVMPINTQHTGASTLVDGQNILNFKAAYISTAAAVTTGHANATADFQFEYK